MKRLVLSLALATSLVPFAALACDGDGPHQAAKAGGLATTTVAQLATWAREKKVTPVDANGAGTRTAQGVIPGALLLSSSTEYDLKELPANKATKLVFYCANAKCGASHAAAQRAVEAGYTDVAVLPDGIVGWKKAGQPTAKPSNT